MNPRYPISTQLTEDQYNRLQALRTAHRYKVVEIFMAGISMLEQAERIKITLPPVEDIGVDSVEQ